ncbi:MAG: hypothetical protein E7298_14545, partial [Lachnospiraceae bacterium]|nr:hypothetical protein [Lachnospiraceae bacterium]
LFAAPTPAQLSAYLAEEQEENALADAGLFRTLTPAQRAAAREAGIEERVECVYPACGTMENRLWEQTPWPQVAFWLLPFDGSTVERLQKRLAELARAHQSLRSVFLFPEGERPVQAVLRDYPPVFFYEDRSSDGDAAEALSGKQKTYLGRLVRYDLTCPPELTRGPLYRVRLIRTGEDRAVLYWLISHTLLDGQSMMGMWGELLDSGAVMPDDREMGRYFTRLLHGARDEAEAYWSELFDGRLTALPAPVEKGMKSSVRSLKAGGGTLWRRLSACCRERGVTVAAALHFCLGRALLSLTGEASCAFLSVSGGRSGASMELMGNFTYAFPFVYKRGDSLRDCQEQLARAAAYAWVWSLPGRVPFPIEQKNTLILDVISLFGQRVESGYRSLTATEALDIIGIKAIVRLNLRQAERGVPGMMLQYDAWSGHLCTGSYNPSLVDEGFAAKLLKGLSHELEAWLIQREA